MIFFLKPYIFYDTHDPGVEDGELDLWRRLVAKGIADKVDSGEVSKETVEEVIAEVRKAGTPKSPLIFDLEDRGVALQKQIARQMISISKWMEALDSFSEVLDKIALAETKRKLTEQQAMLEYQLKVFQALIMEDELMMLCLAQ